jgi:anti-sigma B factor antagonist
MRRLTVFRLGERLNSKQSSTLISAVIEEETMAVTAAEGANTQVIECPVLRAQINRTLERTKLGLEGEIDLSAVPALRKALDGCSEQGPALVVVDLSKVGFCDCSGLRELSKAARTIRESGRTLRITGAKASTRRLFELAGSLELLAAADSPRQAARSAPAPSLPADGV